MPEQFDDDIDLREYLAIIIKRWKIIVFLALFFALSAFILSKTQKPVYESASTVLMKSSGGAGISQYAGIAGALGINLNSGGGNISDLIELLKSKAVAEKVLDDLKLTERIKGWDSPDVRRQSLIVAVSGMIKTPKASGNILEVKAQAGDPQLAADIANGYVLALSFYWNELNYTEAKKKLQYIYSELPRVEQDLKTVENKLKLTSRSSTGFSMGGQSGTQRDYDIHSSVYTMLKKELESAKLDAAKEMPPFSIIDRAVKPDAPSKPKVKLNVMIGLVLGLFSGIFLAFFLEYWKKSNKKE